MALIGSVGVSAGNTSGSEQLKYEEEADMIKDVLNTTKTSSNTVNSGSTNTSNSNTTGGTAASSNTTNNSGSVNTTNIGGSSSTTYNSGRVDTSQLMLTEEAVNHLTKQMLESTQGLAAVSKGQNMSGGYNTTANTLITNDLLSRVAGDVAAKSAKTINTMGASSSSTVNSGSVNTQNIGASTTTQTIGATNNFSNQEVTNIIGGSNSKTDAISELVGHEVGKTTTTGSKDKETEQSEVKTEAKAGWILCTELYNQKRMPHRFYLYGHKAFAQYDEQGKKGYYIWAVPALKHLKAHPYSLLSKVICKTMNARAEHLASEHGCKRANKSVLGYITKHLLYGICWTLSRTIARNYAAPAFTAKGVTP